MRRTLKIGIRKKTCFVLYVNPFFGFFGLGQSRSRCEIPKIKKGKMGAASDDQGGERADLGEPRAQT